MRKALGSALCLLLACAWLLRPVPALRPGSEEQIEDLIEKAIAEGRMPGAVVLIGHRGRIVYRRAFGNRALEPVREAMTVDTIFDLSSLTKVVATATSVMLLAEQGRLRLSDRLGRYIPRLQDPLAASCTLEQLLTHTSGYASQLDLTRPWQGREGAYKELQRQSLLNRPGTQYRYSDINYIALGFVVEQVARQDLATFTHDQLWVPLGIADTTGFRPPASLAPIAPTEWRDGKMLRGSVHGLQAARMGGIAGNGGLFSRGDDLARYCQMILDGGRWQGQQILGPLTLARMVRPVVVSDDGDSRGLGWDLDSPLAASRGDFFPRGSFGHTGYAGSSIWIDPTSQTYVIFLSNMVHPRDKGNVREVRARLFSLVAASLLDADTRAWSDCEEEYAGRLQAGLEVFRSQRSVLSRSTPQPVKHGVSALQPEDLANLQGQKVGVVGPPATLARLRAARLQVEPIYSPPPAAQLARLTQILLDLPSNDAADDTLLRQWMQLASKEHLPICLLDHPCWLGGENLEGPVAAGSPPLALQPAMTSGEIAGWLNQSRNLKVKLRVVKVQGWTRSSRLEEIGAAFEAPQPGLDNLEAVLFYPALALLERTNLSVGLGTDRPYGWLGAPWIDSQELASTLNRQGIPGIRVAAHARRPRNGIFAGQQLEGIDLLLVDRSAVRCQRIGLEIGAALHHLYPTQWHRADWISSFHDSQTEQALSRGVAPADIESSWRPALLKFRQQRQPYLLYP